mmetsp:Transcript_76367/g.247745  ORF Transcript_76367/g.247745 Transcript_76367/m.247745 type:complete len:81 (-) Transcript_76367:1315-1557(-)
MACLSSTLFEGTKLLPTYSVGQLVPRTGSFIEELGIIGTRSTGLFQQDRVLARTPPTIHLHPPIENAQSLAIHYKNAAAT